MAKAKRNVFALLGWLVWKLLSFFGVKFAKDKLKDSDRQSRRSTARR